MGVNFSSFEIGKRALRASQLGLTVAGQNIANVNTPGYTRQAVQLSATPSDGVTTKTVGMGVTVDGVRSFRERFLESRLQTETGISGRLTAKRDALAPVETTLSDADGNGINASITKFFNSFSDLEAHPSSVPLRSAVIGSGNQLASDFHSTRSRLVEIRRLSDSDLRATTDQVNELSGRVADLNGRIRFGENSNASVSELRDQRGELIRQISELTGARSVENNDFTVNLTLGDGRALVTGDTWSKLTAQNTPPDGLATLVLDGAPAVITDGKLKGLTEAIGDIGTRIGDLDSLAASIAARVNTIHAGGSDLDGVNGTNFFTVPVGGVNAANLSVSAALQSNPRLVVAAGLAAGSGDGTVARNIAALLSDSTSVSGSRTGTFTSIYGSIVADAGAGVKTAEDALATQQAILSQVTAQRDSFSGVSLDEEAISLMQYQKAYEAAARFLKIADEMTQTILSIGQ